MSQVPIEVRAEDVTALLAITRRLADLLTAETTALRAMRPQDIAPMQDEKAELTGQYERRLRQLQAPEASFGAIDAGLFSELKERTAALTSIIVDNKRALTAARTVNERLLRTIAEEIARQRNPAQTYARLGRRQRPPRKASAQTGPLKLDAQI